MKKRYILILLITSIIYGCDKSPATKPDEHLDNVQKSLDKIKGNKTLPDSIILR